MARRNLEQMVAFCQIQTERNNLESQRALDRVGKWQEKKRDYENKIAVKKAIKEELKAYQELLKTEKQKAKELRQAYLVRVKAIRTDKTLASMQEVEECRKRVKERATFKGKDIDNLLVEIHEVI